VTSPITSSAQPSLRAAEDHSAQATSANAVSGTSTTARDRSGEADSRAEGGASAAARLASSVVVRIVALVIALVVAVGAAVQVYRIGDSGAKAAWQGRFSTNQLDTGR
jgi:hypothetical protein